jgi:sodium-dependent dicarboxylate transporter 2/3/5
MSELDIKEGYIPLRHRSFREQCLGHTGYRPVYILIGCVFFLTILLGPIPESLLEIVDTPGVPGYRNLEPDETITEHLSHQLLGPVTEGLKPQETAYKAKCMVAILAISGVFWATGALPLGVTAFLLGFLMYLLGVLPPDLIAKSYMKDAVFFIIGALSLASGVHKTNFDKRLGLILLGRVKNRKSYVFLFGPLVAVVACFISAKCLIAFLIPVLMGVYSRTVKDEGLQRHKPLGTFLVLVLVYCTAMGGPGAPTAGARNAIMMAFFSEEGIPMSFSRWMMYGMPFVPVGSLAVGIYLYFAFKRKIRFHIYPQKRVREEAEVLGTFGGREARMAFVLLVTIILWITMSDRWGLGGPAIVGMLLMILLRIVSWEDIEKQVSWEVVWMYAGACALGSGLMMTGAALWLAVSFIGAMPAFLGMGDGMLVSVSLLTSILTNFMSDGAAVALVGPVTLSMARVQNLNMWQIGLATASSSSFAHCMVIGRPGLAIAYAVSRDPETGDQLLTISDLWRYGLPLMFISWFLLWIWTFLGYWKWLPWG